MKSNSINVPEAKEAMERFKMEAASEVDVPAPSYKRDEARSGQSNAYRHCAVGLAPRR